MQLQQRLGLLARLELYRSDVPSSSCVNGIVVHSIIITIIIPTGLADDPRVARRGI